MAQHGHLAGQMGRDLPVVDALHRQRQWRVLRRLAIEYERCV
jgi:hypothetical protein